MCRSLIDMENDAADMQLQQLASQICPPANISDAARLVINDVVKCLQEAGKTSPKFSVARSCVAGSFGKGTQLR